MNNEAARILAMLVARYGTSVALDPLRCEALLRDTCPRCSRQIFVLVNAVRHKVPADLLAPRHTLPPALFKGFLVKRLQDELAFSQEAAQWAVDTWARALDPDNEADRCEPDPSSRDSSKPGVSFPEGRSYGTPVEERAEWALALESGNPGERIAIIRRMSQVQDKESVRLLITCLENVSWRVREAAFDALLELGEPAAPCLVEALADPHERIVVPAIIALGAIRTPAAVDPLIAMLDDENGTCAYVASALGEIRDTRAITPLTRLLNSGTIAIRFEAENALKKFS
jgi:hypothetical protein